MAKYILVAFLFLASFSKKPINTTPQDQTKSPETTERYSAHADFDWDDDGNPDNFDLRVEKQLDYAIASGVKSKEKYWWYHCRLTVQSGASRTPLWQDEWSIKEDDMSSFSEMADFKDAKQFITEWFTIKNNFMEKKEPVNVFEVLQKPVSAEEELLRGEIDRLSIKGFTAKQLKSALEAIHAPRSFCYRATWREDLRCAVYVPLLKRAILYKNGYN